VGDISVVNAAHEHVVNLIKTAGDILVLKVTRVQATPTAPQQLPPTLPSVVTRKCQAPPITVRTAEIKLKRNRNRNRTASKLFLFPPKQRRNVFSFLANHMPVSAVYAKLLSIMLSIRLHSTNTEIIVIRY